MDTLNYLILTEAPPLDPAWRRFKEVSNLNGPKKAYVSPLERQPVYAAECRRLNASMLAPGAPYHHLADVVTQALTAPSDLDGFSIPVLMFFDAAAREDPAVVVVYFHGGGLCVGEQDSEELSCRRVVKEVPGSVVYSVGYRLLPASPASTCVADAVDAFTYVRALHPDKRFVVVGSSSGGQLAATVSQLAPRGSVAGVVLRCPVTCDGGSSMEFVPAKLRGAYTTATPAFATSLGGVFRREVPRDGLERMPLEIGLEQLREKRMGRTWVQVCSNDTLYADGVCYAMLLKEAGVEVEVEVVEGWPHTFWLKAPGLERAVLAEEGMVRGLKWVLEGL